MHRVDQPALHQAFCTERRVLETWLTRFSRANLFTKCLEMQLFLFRIHSLMMNHQQNRRVLIVECHPR